METCVARALAGDCEAAATHAVSSVCEKGHVREGKLCPQHVWSIERGDNPGCRECLDAGDGYVPLRDITFVALTVQMCVNPSCSWERGHDGPCEPSEANR